MKTNLVKKLGLIVFVLIQTTMTVAQTEASLRLGKCQFIQANERMNTYDRNIKIKMSREGHEIPRYIIENVGGVVFVEVAQPAFDDSLLTLSLYCEGNKAYATIDGKKYDIPLDVWMLQPIVKYADDENNVAVTLYGKDQENIPIQFHEAFTDKLLGLRLLQMDILLTTKYVKTENELCGLPSQNGDDYILGPNEEYDKAQCGRSWKSRNEIYFIAYDFDQHWDSYIYTDFEQNIVFDTTNGTLDISGEPYFRFTVFDSVKTYQNTLFLLKKYLRNQIKTSYDEKIYINDFLCPRIVSVLKIAKENIPDNKKAEKVSNIIKQISPYIDTLNQNFEYQLVLRKVKSNYPLELLEYRTLDWALLLDLWYTNSAYTQLEDLTEYLRLDDSLVYYLNPTVVNASKATCQWSAFFRYAKTKVGAKNWNSFVEQVKHLDYDAPKVYTPVKLIYDGQ